MYSNENKKGFSILDLLVKIIFAGVFIFILVWLFQKKIPNINMNPFYSNVFRENIKYMQDAGESYFTDDKMPANVGETYKLTLEEMENLNLIIPFVDKNGESCNKTESYVSVTKLDDNAGYELETNLVCNKESNHVIKILGCHNYCDNCGKVCTVQKETEYQYKKLVSKSKYTCGKGYTLKGKYCYKTVLKDSYDAAYTTSQTSTISKPATVVQGDAKLNSLKVNVTDKTTTLKVVVGTKDVPLTASVNEKEEKYSCEKTKTENQCTTVTKKVAKKCNCKMTTVKGVNTQTCDTCYDTVKQQSCKDVDVVYTSTCTKKVKTYSCPSGTSKQTGSGSSLKCYKTESTYSCPSGTSRQTGSGSSLKCYKDEKVYSCPSGTDVQQGSGSSLKCFKITQGSVSYVCKDSGFKLSGKNCIKTENKTTTSYKCTKKGYKLKGKKCNLYETKKVKATYVKKDSKTYEYKWSKKTSMSGWTKTGKTRTVNGKEICK